MKNPSSMKIESQKYKTNRFTLHQEGPMRWKVSGRDFGGKYRRIRFEAKDLSEAVKHAEDVLSKSVEEKADPKNASQFEPIQISDALFRSCQNQNWSEETRKKEMFSCEYFLKWIDTKKLTFWHELRQEHINEYKHYLISSNYAYDTIRLYMLPVRRAARWVASNYPKEYANICDGIRISRRHLVSTTYDENQGNPYLSIHQVLDFLDYLSRDPKKSGILIGAALQGLMGLQLQEALRLTWGKVDFKEDAIIIDGVVKNYNRVRKLPMVSVVSWILRAQRVNERPTGVLIDGYGKHDAYARAVRREMKLWNPSISIKPKDLRNTLQTEAIDGGWYGYYVQRYVGHAPQTIGERHYHGNQGKRMITFFREKVVTHLERIISEWNAPADATIIPYPRVVKNQQNCTQIARCS